MLRSFAPYVARFFADAKLKKQNLTDRRGVILGGHLGRCLPRIVVACNGIAEPCAERIGWQNAKTKRLGHHLFNGLIDPPAEVPLCAWGAVCSKVSCSKYYEVTRA